MSSGMGIVPGTGTRPTSPPSSTSALWTGATAVLALSTPLMTTRTHGRTYIRILDCPASELYRVDLHDLCTLQ